MTPCARDGSRGLLDQTTKVPGWVLEDRRDDVEAGESGTVDSGTPSEAGFGGGGST